MEADNRLSVVSAGSGSVGGGGGGSGGGGSGGSSSSLVFHGFELLVLRKLHSDPLMLDKWKERLRPKGAGGGGDDCDLGNLKMPSFRCRDCGTYHSSASNFRRHRARHHERVVPYRMPNSASTGGRGSAVNTYGESDYARDMARIKLLTKTAANDAFTLPVEAAVREAQSKARGTAAYIVEGLVRGLAEELPRIMLKHELFLRAHADSGRAMAQLERQSSGSSSSGNGGLLVDLSDRSAGHIADQASTVAETNLLDLSLEPIAGKPLLGEPIDSMGIYVPKQAASAATQQTAGVIDVGGPTLVTQAGDDDCVSKSDFHLSVTMAFLLRHGAEQHKLPMLPGGFIYLDDVLNYEDLRRYSQRDVERVVAENDKKRFFLATDPLTGRLKVRANQGHTFEVADLELDEITEAVEYPIVVHGTYMQSWRAIKYEGLKRMGRNHIHFATGEAKVDGVGRQIRGSCDVLIYIDLQRALNAGIKFYRSANNVILTPGDDGGVLSPKYFAYAVDRHTRKNLPL